MLTSDAVGRYVRSVRGVRALSGRTVRAVWRELPNDAEEATGALLVAVPRLIEVYGELSGVAAVDFYDEVRDRPGFRPTIADPPPTAQVEASERWAVTPLFRPDPDDGAALARVISIVDRVSVNRGHDTVIQSGEADPARPRFARVPVGDTCAWCRALASRGAVYITRETADMATSHDRCDCKVSPVFENDDLPYDRDALYREYSEAAQAAGTSDLKAVTSKMRQASSAN